MLAEGEKLSTSPLRAYLMSYEPHKVRWMFLGELRQPGSIRFLDGATGGPVCGLQDDIAFAPAALPAARQPAASADVAESAPGSQCAGPQTEVAAPLPDWRFDVTPEVRWKRTRDLCGAAFIATAVDRDQADAAKAQAPGRRPSRSSLPCSTRPKRTSSRT